MAKKHLLPFLIIGLLFFYTFAFFFRSDYSFDQDLGRHIKLGEIISETGAVPKTNLFSYTFPSFNFINHHYLFEVWAYQGQKLVGVEGLLAAKIFLVLLSLLLICAVSGRKNYLLLLSIGYIFLHTLRGRTDLRPEIFSFLFTSLTYFILNRFCQKPTKLVFLLPAIQLLWVNSHIYFPLGLGLQAIFIFSLFLQKESAKAKTLSGVFAVSAAACLVNPNFVQGFLYPLQVFSNYGYTIAENQNMFLLESINFYSPDFLFVKLAAFLIIASIIYAWIVKRLTAVNFFLPLFGLGLALANIRSFPYLVFISLPSTIANFSALRNAFWIKAAAGATVFLLLAESLFYLSGDYYRYTDSSVQPGLLAGEHGKSALDFVLSNNLPQPIFNNFDIGSYIIYRGFPNLKVFVDGRPEAYPADFFQNVYIPMQTDPKIFAQIDGKIKFQTIIFSHTDQTPWGKAFLQSVVKNPQWKVVYFDDFMVVLVKDEAVKQRGLKAVSLADLKPGQYHFESPSSYIRMGLFLLTCGYNGPAKAFTEAALRIFPESRTANLIMANLYSNDYLSLSLAGQYYQKAQSQIWW